MRNNEFIYPGAGVWLFVISAHASAGNNGFSW